MVQQNTVKVSIPKTLSSVRGSSFLDGVCQRTDYFNGGVISNFLPYPYVELGILSNSSLGGSNLPHICFSFLDRSITPFLQKIAHTSEIYASYFPSGVRLSVTFSEGGTLLSACFSGLGGYSSGSSQAYSLEDGSGTLQRVLDSILGSLTLSSDFKGECFNATISGYLTLTSEVFEGVKDKVDSLEVLLAKLCLLRDDSLVSLEDLVWVTDTVSYPDFSFDSVDEVYATLEGWGFTVPVYSLPVELEEGVFRGSEEDVTSSLQSLLSSVHSQMVEDYTTSEVDLPYAVSGVSFTCVEGTNSFSLYLPFSGTFSYQGKVVGGVEWCTSLRVGDATLYPYVIVESSEGLGKGSSSSSRIPLYSIKNVYLLSDLLSGERELGFYLVPYPQVQFVPYIESLGGFLADDFLTFIE